jgi:lysophospholipase L1-like esterase
MTANVFAIGDSVMQGAGPELYGTLPICVPGIEVDAVPYRQLKHAATIVEARWCASPAPSTIVVHLGTNGIFTDATCDELLAATRDAHVLLVNIKAPREWETTVNERLTAGAARWPERVVLVDWHQAASEHNDYLKLDGFHLTRIGALAYADTIARCLAGLGGRCADVV